MLHNLNGPLLKISGILTYNEARAALDCGANTLGFLVGLTGSAVDQVGIDTARKIIERLPVETNTILATCLLDIERIAELVGFVGPSAIQVHGNLPPEGLTMLRALAPGKAILKAVHVTGNEAVQVAQSYCSAADAILLDSRTDDKLDGTGQVHEWSISRRIVDSISELPVYLAGGLNAENVAEAIRMVCPDGVDVNTWVEDPQGGKSCERIAGFVAAARTAFAEQMQRNAA